MIELRDINKSFGNKKILSDISLKLNDSEAITIIGASGSGKTTLANIMALFIPPDSGKILLDGIDLLSLKPRERNRLRSTIQLIPQHPYSAFNPEKTLLSSLSEGAVFLRLANKKNAHEYLIPYLRLAGLDEKLLGRKPHELSGGEIQKAAIARALSVKPKVVIADETTSALDAINTREIVETIKALKDINCSTIFITHELKIGKYIASKCFQLKDSILSPYVFS